MIDILVSKEINAPPHKIFAIITKFQDYKLWWSVPVEVFDKKENYYVFYPILFVKIGVKLIHMIQDQEVLLEYVEGPFRGKGKWLLTNEQNHQRTIVSYYISLQAVNFLIELAAQTQLFRNKHILDINNIMEQIEERAKRL